MPETELRSLIGLTELSVREKYRKYKRCSQSAFPFADLANEILDKSCMIGI